MISEQSDASATADPADVEPVVESEAEPRPPADTSCPFVDLETQQQLASRLLSCLANQTVLQKRSASDGAARLRLMLLPDDKVKKSKGGLSLTALDERVAKAEAKAGSKGLGHEGFATALFTSKDELQRRHAEALRALDAGDFRHSKRERLAAELICAWDSARTSHCGECLVPGSEAAEKHRLSCAFRPVACSNAGCVEYFSARLQPSHDGRCPFKLLPCSRGCGATLERQLLRAHEEGPCPHKPATCPLAHLGCECVGLTQGTLAAHIAEAAPQHVLLVAASLGAHRGSLETLAAAHAEQTTLVQTLRGRLAAADEERVALRREVAGAMKALEKADAERAKELAQLKKDVAAALKQGGGAASQSAKELKSLGSVVEGVRKQQAALTKQASAADADLGALKSEQARLSHALQQGAR